MQPSTFICHRMWVLPNDQTPVSLTVAWNKSWSLQKLDRVQDLLESSDAKMVLGMVQFSSGIVMASLTVVFTDGKTFQNLSVSSPAPVTIVCMPKQVEMHVRLPCRSTRIAYIYSNILHVSEQGFDAIPGHQVTWQDRAPANYGQLGLQPIKR